MAEPKTKLEEMVFTGRQSTYRNANLSGQVWNVEIAEYEMWSNGLGGGRLGGT
jgi:hypothetical protein